MMKPKKTPKCDLQALSGVFFAIGLVIATGFSLWAINIKMEKSVIELLQFPEIDHPLDEPVFQIIVEPPPPPIIICEFCKIGCGLPPDTLDTFAIKDTLLESEQDIPYYVVQDKPKFEACKDVLKTEELNQCFKQELDKHVKAHLSYSKECEDICVEGRVNITFRITKSGAVEIVSYRGAYPSLKQKGVEIISKLPRLIPGRENGQPVNVIYTYPIIFKRQP